MLKIIYDLLKCLLVFNNKTKQNTDSILSCKGTPFLIAKYYYLKHCIYR